MNENDWADLARELIRAVNDNGPNAAEIWSAVGTWVTLLVGAAALYFAKGQLDEASQAREQTKELELEKSQPYVVLTMEESVGPEFIDLVVRNYGHTVAYDVKIELDPWPKRAEDEQDVRVPEVIPVMAPGQEWRTHWDFGRERMKSELPDRHVGKVTYLGINKAKLSSDVILDWSIYKSRIWTVKHGMHDLAKAVREIRDTHKMWNEPMNGGMKVVSRDGDAKDEARERSNQEWREQRAAEEAVSPTTSRRRAKRPEPQKEAAVSDALEEKQPEAPS